MKYYAIINEENICIGYAKAHADIVDPLYIEISSLPAPEGKKWNGADWEEVEQTEEETEPTEMEQLQADIAYIKMKMKGM